MSTKISSVTLLLAGLLLAPATLAETHSQTMNWRFHAGGSLGMPLDNQTAPNHGLGLAGFVGAGLQLNRSLTLLLTGEYLRYGKSGEVFSDPLRKDVLVGLQARIRLQSSSTPPQVPPPWARKTHFELLAGAGYDRSSLYGLRFSDYSDRIGEIIVRSADSPWISAGLGVDRDFTDRLGLFIDGRLNVIFGTHNMTMATFTAGVRLQ